ncbi:helix-turn-helix domain-containing protein [Cloacibacillus porcorum]|uniref:helix-turn-helix domain-containing protein n=1 Tax=Cloacibacillus porcorum TaxID=1197717 RepID=UPI003F11D809
MCRILKKAVISVNKNELRYLRLKNNLTQRRMCEIIGISCNRYSRIERGYVVPTEAECEKLAEYLGICERKWRS